MVRVAHPDPVERLFRGNPLGALRFLQPLLRAGLAYSLVMTFIDARRLSSWMSAGAAGTRHSATCPATEPCERYSWFTVIWVFVQVTLQCLQLPLRFAVLHSLRRAGQLGEAPRVGEQLMLLARSLLWRANKLLGGAQVCWHVVGLAVFRGCEGGSACGMRWLVLFHLAIFSVRGVATFAWFGATFFAGELRGISGFLDAYEAFESRALVDALPVLRYAADDEYAARPPPAGEARRAPRLTSCVICLEDYAAGEELRCLGCQHYFHAACLAQWLCHRRACPLCQKWDATAMDAIAEAAGLAAGGEAGAEWPDPEPARRDELHLD